MDWSDLKNVVGKAAPVLGTLLGGPAGAAVGGLIASALGTDSTPDAVSTALIGNPDAIVKLQELADNAKVQMQQLAVTAEQNRLQAETAQFTAAAADRQDAREKLAGKDALWWIAALILLTFAVVMSAALYGSWSLLEGGITIKDVSVATAVSGLVGSIVGYVAANAQTVINFLFGGSMGNEKNAAALARSVQTSTEALATGNNTPWQPAAATTTVRTDTDPPQTVTVSPATQSGQDAYRGGS